TLSTTFAVLRPTPGSASSASREGGTAPPCSSTSLRDSAMTFFALVRNRPIVLMYARTRSSPSAAILAGVSAAANKAGVALLTPASVACAESTTAISSVNGLRCSSSVCGSGSAALKRRNASSISAGGRFRHGPGRRLLFGRDPPGGLLDRHRLAGARLAQVLRGAARHLALATAGGGAECLAGHSSGIVSAMAADNDPTQESHQESHQESSQE